MGIKIYKNDVLVKNKNQKDQLEYAISTFLSYWSIQISDISVIINFESPFIPNEAVAGTFQIQENYYHIHFSKGLNLSPIELFTVLAHEVVHIKQYYHGELIRNLIYENEELVGEEKLWLGKDVSSMDYNDLPHEKEAYFFQDKMVNEILKELEIMSEFVELSN